MDPAVKNLRDWVLLLMALFCVLDIAGVQYAMSLPETASWYPNAADGRIVGMFHGPRGGLYRIYVTSRQVATLYGVLGAAGASLLGALGLVVAHGMRQALRMREAPAKKRPISRHPHN